MISNFWQFQETVEPKPREKIPNGNQVERTEKTPISDHPSSESKLQKHGTVGGEKTEQGRRTSVSRRESVKNEQRSIARNRLKRESKISNDTTKASKESKDANDATKASKDTKTGGDGTKGSRENIVSSRRSSNVSTRKSSLKDNNRKVIDKKLQSVAIKEEREEEPTVPASGEWVCFWNILPWYVGCIIGLTDYVFQYTDG